MTAIARAVGLFSIVAVASTGVAVGGEVMFSVGVGGAFSVPVTSMKEQRLFTVVEQQYDFSCGAASVATLLTYHYGRPTEEAEIFTAMYEAGDQQKIQVEGFSMLDMKNYLDATGFHSDGFRLTLEKMKDIGVPMITLIDIRGYRHFVVVKGIDNGKVLVGDPAFGMSVMSAVEFESIWSGTALAIRDDPPTFQQYFNIAEEWAVRPEAPIGEGRSEQGLGSFTVNLPDRSGF